MISVARARLALIATSLLVVALLIVEFPVSELFHQRGELASTSYELSVVQGENAGLSSQIRALHANAQIGAIAHSDYGLITPGQISYVVLPSKGAVEGEADTLSQGPIPKADVVPGDAAALVARSDTQAPKPTSIWSKIAQRLFFWRWAF